MARSVRCRASPLGRPPPSRSSERSSRRCRSAREKRGQPAGGELDGQRHPVEPADDVGDQCAGPPASAAAPGRTRRGPVEEDRHRRDASARSWPAARAAAAAPAGRRTRRRSPSGSRLVASTVSRGQAASTAPTVSRTASSRCSQLSITSRPGRSPSTATQAASTSPWTTVRSSAAASACGMRGRVGDRREQQHRRGVGLRRRPPGRPGSCRRRPARRA